MTPEIMNPRVLFVTFEKDESGEWLAVIPHGYGHDKPATFIINEELSLQFQPTQMKNVAMARKVIGVGCLPLSLRDKPEPKK